MPRSKTVTDAASKTDTPDIPAATQAYATAESVTEFRQHFDEFSAKILKKLDTVETNVLTIGEEIKVVKSSISELQVAAADSASRVEALENDTIPALIKKQKECDQSIRDAMTAMEIHERKRNLLFYGIEKKNDENIQEVIRKAITSLDVSESTAQNMIFNNVHRLPRKPNENIKTPDPIIVRFVCMSDRNEVLAAFERIQRRPKPAKTPDDTPRITIRTDLPAELKKARYQLEREAYNLRKTQNMSTRIRLVGVKLVLEHRPKSQTLATWTSFHKWIRVT